MSAELIGDEDALYYARAWVRSMPPSRVLSILSERLTGSEVLALLDAVETDRP